VLLPCGEGDCFQRTDEPPWTLDVLKSWLCPRCFVPYCDSHITEFLQTDEQQS
jgi:hypothetical protein